MKAIKYVFAKDAAALEVIQRNAVKSVQKARECVQVAAVATIKHAYDHGDWSYAGKLVEALGNTINGKALIEWFKLYGGLKTDDNGFIGWSGKEYIETNFEKAKAGMWWELKAVSPFKGFDLEAALQRVIKEHKSVTEKVVGMTPEDQAKVNLQVNDATIKAVLKLCNFDAIIGDEDGSNGEGQSSDTHLDNFDNLDIQHVA
jgi:hypothetical protein